MAASQIEIPGGYYVVSFWSANILKSDRRRNECRTLRQVSYKMGYIH